MKAFATKYLGQEACEYSPGSTMADKDQELILLKIYKELRFDKWKYSVQDVEKRWPSFYATEDEITLKDFEENDICPHCVEGTLETVIANEPYNSTDFLMCNQCDSTYNIKEIK